MTEATPLASEQITQEDREAVSAFLRSDECPLSAKMILGAKPAYLAQAFARHRIAALSASPAPSGQGVSGERWEREDAGSTPWGYGWYDDGGGKHTLPHLPTVDALRDVSGEAFPLYRAPAPSCAPGEVEREWSLPDLRDLHTDVQRIRDHDLGNKRMRDLLRATMDTLVAADAEYAALSPQRLDAKEGGE